VIGRESGQDATSCSPPRMDSSILLGSTSQTLPSQDAYQPTLKASWRPSSPKPLGTLRP
jgi:hypothetical protein